jgi:hypothetical protein
MFIFYHYTKYSAITLSVESISKPAFSAFHVIKVPVTVKGGGTSCALTTIPSKISFTDKGFIGVWLSAGKVFNPVTVKGSVFKTGLIVPGAGEPNNLEIILNNWSSALK